MIKKIRDFSLAIFDKYYLPLILIGETVLGALIIRYIPYTEIDWVAYMDQVKTFLAGERDYLNIKVRSNNFRE